MASSFRPYYPRVQNRPQTAESDDVQRGMLIGSAFGKDIQGLGAALAKGIQEQKQNQIANQLLAQNYPDTPADPNLDPNADLSTDLPEDVSTDIGGTATPGAQGNFQGGLAELKLRQEAAKEALSQQNAQAEIAKANAAKNLATLRGNLATQGGNQPQTGDAGAWSGYQMGGGKTGTTGTTRTTKTTAQEQPVQIGSEPVTNQSQLVNNFDGTYGKGSFGKVISNLDQVDTTSTPGFVLFGPPDKQIKVPTGDAQAYVKQQNALRLKQGLTPFPVPGENASLGSSVTNPYPTKNNLDVYSRPPGSWVTLPNGKVAQVPNR